MHPPVLYHLSNRQRKELLVRGAELSLALPVPLHPVDDPLDWARSVLPTDLRDLAVSADEEEVFVNPDCPPGGLAGLIGALVPEPDGATYVITVAVIVVTLQPATCRRRGSKIQWPAEVLFRGRTIPGTGDRH